MEKILRLKNALEALGVITNLDCEMVGYCRDGKRHKMIILSTNIWTGEDTLDFVFHPKTHKLVDDYKELPIVKDAE